jgi:dipeptidyl aminopeptidase/acylaminoacyl peptidase
MSHRSSVRRALKALFPVGFLIAGCLVCDSSWADSRPFSVAPFSIAPFSIANVLDYPFTDEMAAASHGDAVAWVRNVGGVRNVWLAKGPAFAPHVVTQYTDDDGQEITQLTFSPDGARLLFVRGGDHDANWPAEGNLAPDPDSATEQPQVTIFAARAGGGAPVKIADGDAPALSAKGTLAYIKDDQVWTAALDGKGKPERLFFDRGKDGDLTWSPDGTRLAFVSNRGDHSFIGIYAGKTKPILYLAPSTNFDLSPRWSPDGTRIAYAKRPGDGGAPEPMLKQVPHPWSLWVANADPRAGGDGSAHKVWQSPDTLPGSWPEVEGEANLHWAAGDRLVFLAELDNWPHLYSVSANGGAALLLTPGQYMVEHLTMSRDLKQVVFDANTGTTKDDGDRRHLFRVAVDRAGPTALTSGTGIEWKPVAASDDRIAYVQTGAQSPPEAAMIGIDGSHRATLNAGALPKDFPESALIAPEYVSFKSADGWTVHGQLFETPAKAGDSKIKPGIIFVHGGPPRQMLLGWHYMDYYSNAYAVNQYLAAHGFVVLSVNYRLGIGYGRAFQEPDHWGPTGASEYQDVVAGAHFLQKRPNVDATRIGMWGGSYGGYLTGLALARNSDIFKAGVDMHGVHDWSNEPDMPFAKYAGRYEKSDLEEAKRVAFLSSPDASIDTWKSPVLLIQGDDDRNVPFHETVDLARRLDAHHVNYEELVIPNEIHGFLRHASWQRADEATAAYFAKVFGVK